MAEYSTEFLKRTIEVWQPYYSTPLTLEDAREIAENMVNLATLLLELDEMAHEEGKQVTDPSLICSSQQS